MNWVYTGFISLDGVADSLGGLIDRYNLLVSPYLLGAGKSIFSRVDRDGTALRLRESQAYPNGVLKVIYDVIR